ncbi:hypothetical protein BOX15_Mlig011213g1 [Macrostomum lignano]|uniref:Uncharacterized protein n=2 Tax=Macrostomum lignano TaxID=282301 RepID=A0A267F9R6_9PLAT|nr:hypothetical protein BOX15_Mlig030613g2 [Macrostomum lignano]PAA70531.1 hypothetical protein BOX15_Mlig030613g1 [Macrostomum lignano]PAA74370.1 hypothetical protein BOX15_Mlig011213g1 [Macrostomum lignano]
MSDTEGDVAAGGPMTIETAVQEVLKTSMAHDGLAKGLHEATKALEKRAAHLCILASDCDEANYSKLVEALCTEHGIRLVKVDQAKQLGEWAGLCKIDKEGKPRKVVKCSCVVVRDLGSSQASQALDFLLKAGAE